MLGIHSKPDRNQSKLTVCIVHSLMQSGCTVSWQALVKEARLIDTYVWILAPNRNEKKLANNDFSQYGINFIHFWFTDNTLIIKKVCCVHVWLGRSELGKYIAFIFGI